MRLQRALAALALLAACTCAPSTSAQPPQEDRVIHIHITLGEQVLPATLDDSPAGRDFAALLPLSLTLEDYAHTEKVAQLPRALTTQGAPGSYAASAGDLTYYAPWGNLAIFYKDFRSASGLVRLGQISGDLQALRRSGDLQVQIKRAPQQP